MRYADLLPLDNFLNVLFLPAISRCSREEGLGQHDANFARLILFETLSWLSIGAKVEIFPWNEAQALCRQYFPVLNEQYQLFPSELTYLLSGDQEVNVQTVLEKGTLAAHGSEAELAAGALITSRLQIAMELTANVNCNQSVRSMCTAVLLLDAGGWQRLSGDIAAAAVEASLHGVQNVWIDGNKGFAFSGVFHTIRHIEGLIDLLDYSRRPENIDFPEWALLRGAVYRSQKWRFNLRDERYFERFETLASKLVRAADNSYSEAFSVYIQDLRKRWGALEGLVRAGTA